MKKTLVDSGLNGLLGARSVVFPLNANRAMASPIETVWDIATTCVSNKNPVHGVCECVPTFFSCHANLTGFHSHRDCGILIDMEIIPGRSVDRLGDHPVPIWCCEKDHEVQNLTKLCVDEFIYNNWLKDSFPQQVDVHNAVFRHWGDVSYVDVATAAGFIVFPNDNGRSRDDGDIRYAEVFSGGFGGWSQAASILADEGFSLDFKFAIDHDATANKVYGSTFKHLRVVSSFAEACRAFVQDFSKESSSQPLFQADFSEGWWMNFAARTAPDVICASCPCPPWSYPNMSSPSSGLLCDIGLLLPETLWKAMLMGARVMIFENVATLKQHPHWPVVVAMFEVFGWKLAWDSILNLSDLIPQNRSRYLAVLVRLDCEEFVAKPSFVSWPKSDQPTLGSYGVHAFDSGDWSPFALVSSDHMKAFKDPHLLPKSTGNKRQCLNLDDYRLRGPTDIFATIMAAYSSQADIDMSRLMQSGLYGALISWDKTWKSARYLLAVEAYILMGGCVNTVLPLDRKQQFRILGNAIATPHALICWINGLMLFPDRVSNFPDVVDLFREFFRVAFRSNNVVCTFTADGILVQRKGSREARTPKESIAPSFLLLVLECGPWQAVAKMPTDFRPFDALRILCAPLAAQHADVLPSYSDWGNQLHQKVDFPLHLDLSHLAIDSTDSKFVLLLNRHCPLLVMRHPHAKQWSYSFDIMIGSTRLITNRVVITTCAGRVLDFFDPIPQVVFLHDGPPADVDLCPSVHRMPFCLSGPFEQTLSKRMSLSDGFRLLKFFRDSKLDECLLGVGWSVRLSSDMVHVYDSEEEQRVTVVIEPVACALSMPFHQFQPFLATRLMKHDMPPVLTQLSEQEASLTNSSGDAPFFVRVTLKLCHDFLWTGFVQGSKPLSSLAEPWIKAAQLVCFQTEVRFVIAGRSQNPERLIADFWVDSKDVIRIHLVFPFRGGGTKEELVLMTKNRLGAFLIAQGVSLDDVHGFCPDLIKVSGPTPVLQALDLDNGTKTAAALNELAKASKLSMPKLHDLHARAASRLQKAIRQKALNRQRNLKACQFRLADGFFRNADLTATVVLPKFSLQSSGISLMDRDEAHQWIWNSSLMADELAVIVLGGCGDPRCPSSARHTFPAFNSAEEPVILSGCLHQLGQKRVTIRDDDSEKVDLPTSTVVSVTLWSDEWTSSDWQSIVKGPAKFVTALWTSEGHRDVLLGAPWNRFWKDAKGNACQSEHAVTAGFFFRTTDDVLKTLLKSSGENSVYLFPRSNSDVADHKYLAIWFNLPKHEVLVKGANSSYYYGLVRSNKGYGIRVTAANFKEAFNAWKPGQAAPDRRFMPLLFKIKPVPKGASSDEVTSWLSKQKWDSRVIRSLSSDTWLIAAFGPPPAPFCMFNRVSILIKPVEKGASSSATVVLAGSAPKPLASGAKRSDEDPLSVNDPWANYAGPSPTPSPTVVGRQPDPPRNVDAPLEARFKSYDDQISNLKSALCDVQKDLKESTAAAEQSATRLDGRIDKLDSSVKDSLSQLSKSFADSLAQAMTRQDNQMTANFNDLKALLEASAKVPSPLKKVPRRDGDL